MHSIGAARLADACLTMATYCDASNKQGYILCFLVLNMCLSHFFSRNIKLKSSLLIIMFCWKCRCVVSLNHVKEEYQLLMSKIESIRKVFNLFLARTFLFIHWNLTKSLLCFVFISWRMKSLLLEALFDGALSVASGN